MRLTEIFNEILRQERGRNKETEAMVQEWLTFLDDKRNQLLVSEFQYTILANSLVNDMATPERLLTIVDSVFVLGYVIGRKFQRKIEQVATEQQTPKEDDNFIEEFRKIMEEWGKK